MDEEVRLIQQILRLREVLARQGRRCRCRINTVAKDRLQEKRLQLAVRLASR